MPNWCMGRLTISGSELELRRFAEFAKASESSVLDTKRFVPLPQGPNTSPSRDWYIACWGTKWGICDAQIVSQDFTLGVIEYRFLTAWSACRPIVLAMARRFPSLRFEYTYRERSVGYKGQYVCEAGKVLADRAWACVGYDWRSFPTA